MYFVKALFVLAAVVALGLATPSVDRRAVPRLISLTNGRTITDLVFLYRETVSTSSSARTETIATTTSETASNSVNPVVDAST